MESLTKNGVDVKFRDWTDSNEESRYTSLMYILSNFVILDYMKEFIIINMKYINESGVSLFQEWQHIYNQKCYFSLILRIFNKVFH